MKEIIGLHGPMAVNVDATMWHDYLGRFEMKVIRCKQRQRVP